MKTMTDNEKKELEDKFNEHIKTLDVDFYYDPIKYVWVDLFDKEEAEKWEHLKRLKRL